MLSLFGCLVFRRFVLPDTASAWRPTVRRIGLVSAWLALVFGTAWLWQVSAAIAHTQTVAATFGAVLEVVRYTSFGNLVCLRLGLLAGVLVLLPRQPVASPVALVASGFAVALQPLLGHVGALSGATRPALIAIEVAHLLAAGAWFGGLLPLLLCVLRAPPLLAATLCERFTPVGLVAVGTIAMTALPQAGELVGGLAGLAGTDYGHLALLKLGLFAVALGLACANRLVLTTRLDPARPGSASAARRWLIGSIANEAVAVLCVIFAAAAMASAPPGEHVQPVWPFAWRPSAAAWDEPELRGELIRLLIAAAAGVVLIGISLALRRLQILAVGLAVIVAAPFAPSAGLLLVEAYPTSYAHSTTGFSVDAIVHGQKLFGQFCAACHAAQDGTGGVADLTAPHIWGHLDGELFWWVSNGINGPEGAALMPGFGPVLSAADLWALIDFIHARNVGWQVAATGRWSPAIPAPSTPLGCDGSNAEEVSDLANRVLIVVADGDSEVGVPAKSGDASSPGTITLRLSRNDMVLPADGECVAADAEAWEAWRVLAGVGPEQFAFYRAIVDGQGWLRAWLPPGSGAEQELIAVRDAREHPIAVAAPAGGGHHH